MRFKLTATVTHKTFDKPIIHTFKYEGATKSDVLDQIDTLDCHKHNLDKHGRTAFKDKQGVKHEWKLTEEKE